MSAQIEKMETQRAVLAVPPGLEIPCVRIARRETGVRFDRIAPGLIQSKERADDPRVIALLDDAPIWTFGSFRMVAKLAGLHATDMDTAVAALGDLVDAAGWHGESYWLTTSKVEQSWANEFLSRDFGLVNNPGDYSLTLRVATGEKGIYTLLGRSISVKERFSYRKSDLGISINPVLAACLARLLPQDLSVCAIDPTCGSGTLLFERLRYSKETAGIGIDRDADAQKAFETNLPHVILPGREIEFRMGDARDTALWQPCSSVLCNLPFGMQVREKTTDLDALYVGILKTALQHLTPDGRILMTSSYKRGLDGAVEGMAQHLKLLSRYRAEMGGLFYQVVVLGRV